MDHGHGHTDHAPRRRFRGRKRYFRRVHRHAAAFQLPIDDHSWWSFWHYHADWPGWGNRRWRYRLEHLRALARVFETIAAARDRFPLPFQLWIMLADEDAGQDAVYLHTPNANDTPFPFAPPLVRADTSRVADAVRALLPGFTLDYARHDTTHWLWARGVGEPLAP